MSASDERVKQIIAAQLGVDSSSIEGTHHFVKDLGADSLQTVSLIMALESAFGIEIPDDTANSITTVQAALNYVSQHAR
ncbi:Acyl carrier protein [Pseudomonas fluorescens]|uniref:Acyl carrier protein n=1 Tax=Pseudomonas fluorescens TaxID=294 RepID=A0A5E7ERG2_PSEFL|nr:acyl carrier protein [Pseudomonas fluorescens]VVO29222.1 Acyl carrier protein [Pseudomonas fluorescens]